LRRAGRRSILVAGLLLAACAVPDAQRGPHSVQRPVFDSARAFEHIRQLVTIGPRTPGSPGSAQARAYVRREIEAMGLRAVEQPFDATTPLGVIRMTNVIVTVSDSSGSPVKGAVVTAFTDFANRVGVEGTTKSDGKVTFTIKKTISKFELLLCRKDVGFWGAFKRNVTVSAQMAIRIQEIAMDFVDSVRHFAGTSPPNAGQNVIVGVVDTGVGPHPDLVVSGGQNTVTGEQPGDFKDNGAMHGTHVAGIIAARGSVPTGRKGIAPSVQLRSYRVFGKNAKGAANFAIAKAIDAAVADGCHLINLSLGGGDPDELTQDAIADARERGSLCIIAAGNDGRRHATTAAPACEPRYVQAAQ